MTQKQVIWHPTWLQHWLLLGTLLWSLSLLLVVPAVLFAWQFWLPIVGIALAVIFATSTLFSWFRSRGRTQAPLQL